MDTTEIIGKICRAASDKKAGGILTMDMRGVMFSADYFVICSAPTATQARAIADNVEEKLGEAGVTLGHKEGYSEGEWILLDYGDVVVHVFKDESRDFYALEKLWGDAEITRYED